MRYLSKFMAGAMVAPMALALAGCNIFGGGGSENSKSTPEARVVASPAAGAPGAPAATAPAATTTDTAGGKSAAAATTTRVASNNTDSKGAGSGTGGQQCNDGKDRHVVVRNDTSTTLFRLYGSNVNRTDWEEDVLGSDVLAAGQSVNVNWDDGSCECMFDFKAEFSDNTETVRRAFNVCTESQWRIVE
ncbi:MAG: hypothetical protein ABL909_09920 [Sphingopyxis sp.]